MCHQREWHTPETTCHQREWHNGCERVSTVKQFKRLTPHTVFMETLFLWKHCFYGNTVCLKDLTFLFISQHSV